MVFVVNLHFPLLGLRDCKEIQGLCLDSSTLKHFSVLIYIGNMPILSGVFIAVQYFSVRTVTVVTLKVNKHHCLLLLLDPLIQNGVRSNGLGRGSLEDPLTSDFQIVITQQVVPTRIAE